jgi:hypothetical protein
MAIGIQDKQWLLDDDTNIDDGVGRTPIEYWIDDYGEWDDLPGQLTPTGMQQLYNV